MGCLVSDRTGPINRLMVMTVICFLAANSAWAQSGKVRNSYQLVQDKHRNRFQAYSDQIAKLADECEQKGLSDAAEHVRSRKFVPDLHSVRVDKLPLEVQPEIPAGLSAEERFWRKNLRTLETNYAKDLYGISRFALYQGYPSVAYNLIREASMHDPDLDQVRKILGFVRQGNKWITPFAGTQIRQGNVWNDKYGWLPKSYEAKYNAGERNYNGRWMSAEKEKELRRDFNFAWKVHTDHYIVKTNVSLESGVELAKSLEDFHGVFKETFAGFFDTPQQLKKLFDGQGKAGRAESRPYTVHFYRTREEYLERLRKFFPMIDQTNGIYLSNDRVAHFYLDPDKDHQGTLYHEATHQLFYESDKDDRTICDHENFWVIEGIACYMESFQQNGDSFTLGDKNHIRFRGARHNLLQENYYVPMRSYCGMGMLEFQNAPKNQLVKNYTQAAGMARFFMHYDEGRYREALVQHLVQLYSVDRQVRDSAQSLEELVGMEFTELDRQYREDAVENDR